MRVIVEHPPLVGRDDELAFLQSSLAAAAAGSGGTVVLSGDGGVGKTRLAETLAEHALRSGFTVARGRAFPMESGIPYALFADALTPLVRDLDPATLSTLARGAEPELAVVLPALGARQPRPQSDAAELRGRVLWAVTELVRGLAARQPLLLLLDDLHAADASSLELLHFIARQTTHCRVLVVCTYNETERGAHGGLRVLEQSLLSSGSATVRRILPLSAEQTAELVRRAFEMSGDATREFAALLFSWTRGNPFFVRETLNELVASGRLHRRHDGEWVGWEFAELELPRSIREAVLARLDRLTATAREVAGVAAAIGSRFDHDLLAGVSGLETAPLIGAIDELRRQHVLAELDADTQLRYDFTHPLLRQVLYAELGTARVRLLHATIARVLAQRGTTPSDEIAFHFARAGEGALPPTALRYVHDAGLSALARSADREAAAYLRFALERWQPESGIGRDRITSDLARAQLRLGEYDQVVALLEPLVADAADAPAAASLHRRIGQALYWAGRHPQALAHYQTAAGLVRGTDAEAVMRLGAGVCLQEMGSAEAARFEMQEALAVAERAGDVPLLARTHRALLLLHTWTGPPDEARSHGARAAELAAAAGDTHTLFYAEWGLAVLEGLTGHTSQMAQHIAAIERIAEQQQSPLLRLWTAELLIELNSATGDWQAAIATGEHAIRLARSLNQRSLLPRLLVWTSLVYLGRSDMERAKQYADEAWQLSGADGTDNVDVHSVVPAHIGRAAYHMYARDFAETIRICERGLAVADRSGYTFWAMHRLLPILAEAHCHLWDVEGATRVEGRIRRDAERLGHKVGLAWADTCRALTVWISGNPNAAVKLIRSAAESLESIPVLPDAARLRRQLAGRLAETGDREGALLELKRVHEMFARMGAESELSKARGMFREIGAKPPVRSAATGAEGLSARELEIAQMVAERKSNKAIAKELEISARTVSTHLSNIFRKTGVASRGELVDYVRAMQK